MKMRKFIYLSGMLLLLSRTAAAAEDAPKADVYLGFSLVRALLGQVTPNVPGGSFSLYGGGGAIAYDATKLLGIVADFGVYGVDDSRGGNGHLYSYLFGPRISYRGNRRYRPYAQILAGGANATAGVFGAPVSQQSFAFTVGGGVDVKLFHGIAWRFGQIEVFHTSFRQGAATAREGRNNVRISTGVVFSFGQQ